MKLSTFAMSAGLGLLTGATFAQPQLTVVQRPSSDVAPNYFEVSATGEVGYLLGWNADESHPGEGWYDLYEWRRSTNAYRFISSSPMIPLVIAAMNRDGSIMAHYQDGSGDAWATWSVATGRRTSSSTRRPWAMNESLSPYIAKQQINANEYYPYFVLSDASTVSFPDTASFDAVFAGGVSNDGIAFGGAMTLAGNLYFSVPFTWTAGQAVRYLPSPPTGVSASAVAVTDDGAVIVREMANSVMAARPYYRWTQADGYQPLVSMSGAEPSYYARGRWSSDGRLTMVRNGSNGWVVWSAEHGVQAAGAYLLSRGIDLAGSGLSTIEYQGFKDDGRVFYGIARQGNQPVSWFVTGLTVGDCPADFNGDGFLDFFDYDAFVVGFESGDEHADVNGDGFLDFFDYDEYVQQFEAGC